MIYNQCFGPDGQPRIDIIVRQDETWQDYFTLLNRLDDSTIAPVDITHDEVEIYIRPAYDSTSLIAKLSHSNGLIVYDDPTTGGIGIVVPQATVAAWSAGKFIHYARRILDVMPVRIDELWSGDLIIQARATT